MSHPLTILSMENKLAAAQGWEAKNRVLVQLARELPRLAESDRIEANRVLGCESQVWLKSQWLDGKLVVQADSDSRVVQGLLMLVVTFFSGKTSAELAQLDFEAWMVELGLMRFLSASRGNGLKAIVHHLRESSDK